MRVKVLMQWDIDTSRESEYYDYVVNEFLPRIQRLGLDDIQFWYTTYGECEQIQVSGIASTLISAENILGSEEWQNLVTRLDDLVENLQHKLVSATNGFQL